MAAYKLIELARTLTQSGHRVPVILSESALHFVTPLSFRALTSDVVHVSGRVQRAHEPRQSQVESDATLMPHLRAAWDSDVVVVAPATAETIARLAQGRADDLLAATVLASSAPVIVAPSMNDRMYAAEATQRNLATLAASGMRIVEPESGPLASGHVGMGRLAALESLLAAIELEAHRRSSLSGRRVLVTAGPTHEPVDAVRYLGNRSSGRMGFALAHEAALRGARVTLVTGPTALLPVPGVETISVETAEEMNSQVLQRCAEADMVIMAAAVADVRPADISAQKLKRSALPEALTLTANPDILRAVTSARTPGQIIIGFAAETVDLESNAAEKCVRKGVDLLVANDVSRPGIGFGSQDNEVTLVWPDGRMKQVGKASKAVIAGAILDAAAATDGAASSGPGGQ